MLKLTREGCFARREKLIKAAKADYLIISNPRHIQYLIGMYNTPLALSNWGPNALIIEADSGKTRLIVHNFMAAAAKESYADEIETWRWYDATDNPGIDPYVNGVNELNSRLPALNGKRVGVEMGWLPYGVRVTDPVDMSGTLWEMRRSKYGDELVLIRDAIRVIGAAHEAARKAIKPGLSELDMYNVIQSAMVLAAGEAILLMGDFASGERGETQGGPAANRILQSGELMILDLFPIVNGYRGDYTATLSVDRKLTDKQRSLETALHAGLAAGEAMLKPGSTGGDVYRAVRNALTEHGIAEGLPHHAGHGLGLGHPDAPYFVPNSQESLVIGDVVTLEPGAYGKGFGARIEHNYLIKENGFERLSQHNTSFA